MKKSVYLFLLLLSSCTNYLYVQQETVDESYFASSYVGTPDPRKEDMPFGHKILVSWDLPLSQFRKNPYLELTVRFWDNEQKVVKYVLDKKRSSTSFFFENKKRKRNKKILTYKIDVISEKGEILKTWKHQFWTKLIDVGRSSKNKSE